MLGRPVGAASAATAATEAARSTRTRERGKRGMKVEASVSRGGKGCKSQRDRAACLSCVGGDTGRMKRFSIALMAVMLLLTAGCESMSDATSAVREKFAERAAPQTRTFPAAQRPVYDAVRLAAEQMGYRYVRGGAATGVFEAVTNVREGERIGSARQLSLKVKLDGSGDGGTVVAVRITEIIEADSSNRAGLATETPLRDTPQYEVFFRGVEQALKTPKAEKS